MDQVLGDLKDSVVFPYLDDVIIPSKMIEEDMHQLRQVLDVFRAHNLTLKLKKCSFFSETIEYLERLVNKKSDLKNVR